MTTFSIELNFGPWASGIVDPGAPVIPYRSLTFGNGITPLISGMDLGMGLTGLSSYSGYYPFANILWSAGSWAQQSGAGTFTQNLGVLTATDPSAVFYCKLAEGLATPNLPVGTYTVFNPDNRMIGVGWGGTPSKTGWTTASSFTFTIDGSEAVVALWAKSTNGVSTSFVTNSAGPIQIIMPGCVSSWQAGNYFNPQFLTFHMATKPRVLRFMDWLQTYNDISTDLSESPTETSITLRGPSTRFEAKVPYKVCIDLCNRLNAHMWLNIPVHASDAMIDAIGNLVKNNLNAGLLVYNEFGNETWNTGGGFFEQGSYLATMYNTLRSATPNADGSWRCVGHGLSGTERIVCAFNKEYITAAGDTTYLGPYPMSLGGYLGLQIVDADNFKTYDGSTSGSYVPAEIKMTHLYFRKEFEGSNSSDPDTNFGVKSKLVWNRLDAILGRSRVKHVLGTQLAISSRTATRIAPAGVAADTDMVCVAPYYGGDWWLAAVDIASGQLTPKGWSFYGSGTVPRKIRIAVYAAGSTPTVADIMAGTGTGFIGYRDILRNFIDYENYTAAAPITGLTNGVSYDVWAVYQDYENDKWPVKQTVTVSATASTVSFNDGYDAMKLRVRKDIINLMNALAGHKAAAPSAQIVGYETGSDYFTSGTQNPLPDAATYRAGWARSQQNADVFKEFYVSGAVSGLTLMNQFTDINVVPGVFNIAESLTGTSDKRYVWYCSQNGKVNIVPGLSVANQHLPNITAAPVSLPYTVASLPTGISGVILSGDDIGNFAVSGSAITLANTNGIDWSKPTPHNIRLLVTDGNTSKIITSSVATGDSWYPADASFVWDSTKDLDTTQINPAIGGTINRTGTAPAITAAGLWQFDRGQYYNGASAIVPGIPNTQPTLVAHVMDAANLAACDPYANLFSVGGAGSASINFNPDGGLHAFWQGTLGASLQFAAGALPSGKHVYWTFRDKNNNFYAGYDQTENTAARLNVPGWLSGGSGTYTDAGISNSSALAHGSLLIMGRDDMTLADALVYVSNMQTLVPSAPTSTYLRLPTRNASSYEQQEVVNSAGGWDYGSVDTLGFNGAGQSVSALKIPVATTAASFQAKFAGYINTAVDGLILGLNTTGTAEADGSRSTILCGIGCSSYGGPQNYFVINNGTYPTPDHAVLAEAGDIIRIRKGSGNIYNEVSKDNGLTWSLVHTWTAPSADLYAAVIGCTSRQIIQPTQSGFA